MENKFVYVSPVSRAGKLENPSFPEHLGGGIYSIYSLKRIHLKGAPGTKLSPLKEISGINRSFVEDNEKLSKIVILCSENRYYSEPKMKRLRLIADRSNHCYGRRRIKQTNWFDTNKEKGESDVKNSHKKRKLDLSPESNARAARAPLLKDQK